ncbi:MAG TPA: hypothetical protein VFC63_13425 [Blastocatellia bacterium]|nr:hypothetical protein [Blastocatellia bacterium]
MESRQRASVENESVGERLARLPIGLILFLVLIIALSYYFDRTSNQVRAQTSSHTQTSR